MKLKYILLSLLVLVLASSVVFAAEQASIDDYTFTVPDGFEVTNQSEHSVSLQKDIDHAIVIVNPDEDKSPDVFKAELEDQGYEFGEESNYTAYNCPIEQYNYKKDSYQGFLYSCHLGDDNSDIVYITYVLPEDEDIDDGVNPVDTILKSLAEVND